MPSGKKTILLVEDEALIAMSEKTALEQYGYTVMIVNSGEKAIEAVKVTNEMDLILMDINLGPGIDGTRAAELILKDNEIPLLFLSSHSDREIVEKTERITSYGYVIKNSSITVLDASIKMAFKLFESRQELRKGNAEVSQHAQLLENIIEQFPGFIIWKDPESKILGCNNNFAMKCGEPSPASIIGKFDNDLPFLKDEVASFLADDRFVMQTRKPKFHIEEMEHVANGELLYLDTCKIPLFDPHGKVSGILAVATDITARKKIEEALEESEKKHRLLVDNNHDIIYTLTAAGIFIFVSRAWTKLLGYPEDQVIGSSFQKFIHPDDIPACLVWLEHVIQTGERQEGIEYRVRHINGAWFWHTSSAVPLHDESGKVIGFEGTARDITEHKRAVDAISDARNLMTSMLESSPNVIVFALDTEYRYLAFNSRHRDVIKQIWGRNIDIGVNMLDVIGSHEDAIKAKENFDRALHGESFVIVEEFGNEALSRQSWLDYWSPIKNGAGEIIGLTCFLLNNTDQKRAEDKIKTLLAEKEMLLKEVHHRIKNNMNTVSSLLSLQAGSLSEPAAIHALEEAGNRVRSMAMLYDQLYRSVDYTNLPANTFLAPMIDEILSNFPNRKKVNVEKNLDDFILDSRRLQSLGIIINELLTNIMKYAFIGKDSGLITISVKNSDNKVLLTVQDNGNGIPASVNFEISSSFGLQLVYALSQQLAGTIHIERGHGSKVVLEFKV